MFRLRCAIVVSLLWLSAGELRAADRYFGVFFSYQGRFVNLPARSHTWAVFVRANEHREILEVHEINWLAKDESIGFFQGMEPGRNRELHGTIRQALVRDLRVCMWGPFEIRPELFGLARERSAELEAGMFEYSMIDLGRRAASPNCMHAVSDLRSDAPYLRTLFARGERGTAKVARHLSKLFIPTSRCSYPSHDWVATELGLDAYPIERRPLAARTGE